MYNISSVCVAWTERENIGRSRKTFIFSSVHCDPRIIISIIPFSAFVPLSIDFLDQESRNARSP